MHTDTYRKDCFFGQDAFRAFHNNLDMVKKYLTPIHVGSVEQGEREVTTLDEDFRSLRETATKMVSDQSTQLMASLDVRVTHLTK